MRLLPFWLARLAGGIVAPVSRLRLLPFWLARLGSPVGAAPASRLRLIVPAESRTLTVSAESRTLTVPAPT